jgi:predicted DNA-binding antitoxin AbrB/MazE fold protein
MNNMVHNIDAIYDHGVFRPVGPLSLPDGARVHLRVEEENGASGKSADYIAWLGTLAGRWQGEFTRGNEGDLEVREPLG